MVGVLNPLISDEGLGIGDNFPSISPFLIPHILIFFLKIRISIILLDEELV
jgi:hypothetical protein